MATSPLPELSLVRWTLFEWCLPIFFIFFIASRCLTLPSPRFSLQSAGLTCAHLAFDFLVRYGFRLHRSIRGLIGEWPNIITSLVLACPEARAWLMNQFMQDEKIHVQHFVQCTNKDVRTVYGKMLLNILVYTFNQEGLNAGLVVADKLFDFIQPFMKKELGSHWKFFGQYFTFIYDYALLGSEQRQHLQKRDMLGSLLRFLFVDFNWSKCHTIDFTNVHAIISVLVRASNLSFLEEKAPADQAAPQPPLSNPYQELSFNPLTHSSPKPLLATTRDVQELYFGEQTPYFHEALMHIPGSLCLTQLVQCSVWRSQSASVKLINDVAQHISTSPVYEVKQYFDLMFSILSVPDSLQQLRIIYSLRVSVCVCVVRVCVCVCVW